MAVTMKNAIFWDVTPCGSCKNQHFGGTHHNITVTTNVVPSLPILVTLMMEVIHASEMSVLSRATWCNITKDGILK
jgi:hypothetical protein